MTILNFLFILLLILLAIGLMLNAIGYFFSKKVGFTSEFTANTFQINIKQIIFSTEGIKLWIHPNVNLSEIHFSKNCFEINDRSEKIVYKISKLVEGKKLEIESGEKSFGKSGSIISQILIETSVRSDGIRIRFTEEFLLNQPVIRIVFKFYFENSKKNLFKSRIEALKLLF